MRVLYVTAELYPWVKSGGLGDVAAALPATLTELGIDTRLLLPGFAGFLDAFTGITDAVRGGANAHRAHAPARHGPPRLPRRSAGILRPARQSVCAPRRAGLAG